MNTGTNGQSQLTIEGIHMAEGMAYDKSVAVEGNTEAKSTETKSVEAKPLDTWLPWVEPEIHYVNLSETEAGALTTPVDGFGNSS
jgi:hypothetical protein